MSITITKLWVNAQKISCIIGKRSLDRKVVGKIIEHTTINMSMHKVETIEQIRILISEVRNERKGFLTNFYLEEYKHSIWIQCGTFLYETVGDTLFLIKKSDTFWNVFYCTTVIAEFIGDLKTFKSQYVDITMLFDIVGKDVQCAPLLQMFKEQGFSEATSLVRMSRMTEKMEYLADNSIDKASQDEIIKIYQLLHQYFDEKTEQIPFLAELIDYANQGHILVCHEDEQLAGFLIYEITASTLYLRYWFTYPDYRDKKVGSRMLRRFFEEGKETKRQLFWVIRDNDNAIKRYRHFGFQEENMFDYVLKG
jgi:GNAT superfamily N-acetyltransferase